MEWGETRKYDAELAKETDGLKKTLLECDEGWHVRSQTGINE